MKILHRDMLKKIKLIIDAYTEEDLAVFKNAISNGTELVKINNEIHTVPTHTKKYSEVFYTVEGILSQVNNSRFDPKVLAAGVIVYYYHREGLDQYSMKSTTIDVHKEFDDTQYVAIGCDHIDISSSPINNKDAGFTRIPYPPPMKDFTRSMSEQLSTRFIKWSNDPHNPRWNPVTDPESITKILIKCNVVDEVNNNDFHFFEDGDECMIVPKYPKNIEVVRSLRVARYPKESTPVSFHAQI